MRYECRLARDRREAPPHVAHAAAEARPPGGRHRDHLLQVSAEQLRLPWASSKVDVVESGTISPEAEVSGNSRISRGRSAGGREPDPHVDQAVSPAERSGHLPSRPADSWLATCSTVKPTRAAAWVDAHVTSDCRAGARRGRRCRIFFRRSAVRSRVAPAGEVVAEDLHLDRLRFPRGPRSCLEELHELDVMPASGREDRALLLDDLLGVPLARRRGLSFTTMSPRFCSVAKRPSSAPVRRAKPATSGVAATTSSIRCTIRSVSGSDVPSASSSRSRTRPRPSGAGSRLQLK